MENYVMKKYTCDNCKEEFDGGIYTLIYTPEDLTLNREITERLCSAKCVKEIVR